MADVLSNVDQDYVDDLELIDSPLGNDDDSTFLHPSLPASHFPSTKLESIDDYSLLPSGEPQASSSSSSNRNFRSKKRNRVMQSCVACHAQKRKCDRKRPCTRCTEHGIAGQCVYQLEDPAVRDGPEQDELQRLRSRVADLERTVRVLMQKPLSRRAAAALEAETDAILGTTSTRKRKVDKDKLEADDRARKMFKSHTQSSNGSSMPEWLPMGDPSFPSPVDSTFSPFAPTPSESHFPHYLHYGGYTPPIDVPTPPYSTFPTPSSDAGSPFKVPEPPARRFSDGTTLANMLSYANMAATPESLAAGSPATPASGVSFAPIAGAAPPGECGCGVNPIGNEVLSELQQQLEVAHEVLATLPDHQVGGQCVTSLGIASLIDAIATATRANSTTAMSAPPVMHQQPPPGPLPMPVGSTQAMPPPPPPPISTVSYMPPASSASHMTPASSSHMSPVSLTSPGMSEPGPSPHSSVATPPNYGLYPSHAHHHHQQPYYHSHSEVPTVVGFNSLSSWAAYGGSTTFLNGNGPSNSSTSSLSNFDGQKEMHPSQHQHAHHHHHQHPHHSSGNIVVWDQAHS